jgi:hypothetical protein
MLTALIAAAVTQTFDNLSRHVYPLSDSKKAPNVVIDVSDYPESKAWGEAAKGVVEKWFPIVCTLLSTADYKVPREIKLVIKKEISAPAWAAGNTITISGKWITQHPDDIGMIVHEMTHVIQHYPDGAPGWLVEGIADYIRWWRYEPEAPRSKIDPARAKYTDAYRTTAYWLAWVSRKYDMSLVPQLDLAMRKHEDPMPLFAKLTGKDADALWQEFIAALPK